MLDTTRGVIMFFHNLRTDPLGGIISDAFGMCVTGRMDIRMFYKQMLYDNKISMQINDIFLA